MNYTTDGAFKTGIASCNLYDYDQSFMNSTSLGEKVGINVYWIALFIPGVTLNLLTIIAILRKKTLRNVISNRYIVALATIDGTDMFLMGLSIIINVNTDGMLAKFSHGLCWLFMWCECWLNYASLSLLAVIAVDRYRMVKRVAQYRNNKRFRTSLALGLILPTIYTFIFLGILEGTKSILACYDLNMLSCVMVPTLRLDVDWVYAGVFPLDTFVQVLLLICIAAGYTCIVVKLYQSTTPWGQSAAHRSAEMMVFVCASCILTNIPSTLYNLCGTLQVYSLFLNELLHQIDLNGMNKWIQWTYHISTAVNPIIYVYFNRNLLNELNYMVKCMRSPRITVKPDKIH